MKREKMETFNSLECILLEIEKDDKFWHLDSFNFVKNGLKTFLFMFWQNKLIMQKIHLKYQCIIMC